METVHLTNKFQSPSERTAIFSSWTCSVSSFYGSRNLHFMGSGSFQRCRTRKAWPPYFWEETLIFYLWPLMLILSCLRKRLDLVLDASEESVYVSLHLSSHLTFALLFLASLSLALLTKHLYPLFSISLCQIFFMECGSSRSERTNMGCQRFPWSVRYPFLALCRSFPFSPLLLSHLLKMDNKICLTGVYLCLITVIACKQFAILG